MDTEQGNPITGKRDDPADHDVFWAEFGRQLDALRGDPVAWAILRDELMVWEATLIDGLTRDAIHQYERGETLTLEELWAELDEEDGPVKG